MEPLENPESLMKAMRKWEREDEDESDFMTILAGAMLLLTGQGSSSWSQPRRRIQRAAGGAMGSTMWGYYNYMLLENIEKFARKITCVACR
jgi:hypothetical protein